MHLENCAIAIRFKRKIYVDKRILKKAVKSLYCWCSQFPDLLAAKVAAKCPQKPEYASETD